MKEFLKEIQSLMVYRNFLDDEVIIYLMKLLNTDEENAKMNYAKFLNKLIKKNAEDNYALYIEKLALVAENAFSIKSSNREKLSESLKQAVSFDLNTIQKIASLTKKDLPFNDKLIDMPDFVSTKSPKVLFNEDLVKAFKRYYEKNGCGVFISHNAFTYNPKENALVPTAVPSKITLNDLKDYTEEKAVISDNIESFLKGLPYSNMLLYGDRGTGKSSTVQAMLNNYAKDGLRLVELTKNDITSLLTLKELLNKLPMKFIIFIDDLTLLDYDDKFSTLKASLEGSIGSNTNNTMIIATSNRRHIVKETFSDRDDVHANDTIDEQLSLSDRFGLTVLFMSTSKQEYLSIIKQVCEDMKIEIDDETLFSLAEKWAIKKSGRSPRIARQFLNILKSKYERNLPLNF